MSFEIHPLKLGEVDVDSSYVAWQTDPGSKLAIPCTAWLVTGGPAPLLVDASFRSLEEQIARMGPRVRRPESESLEVQLARHELLPTDIELLLHTHLHVDHTGLVDELPNAKIVVQRSELQYAAAPLFPDRLYDRFDVSRLIGHLWNRLELIDGDVELFPGLRTVVTGGHTPAHQMVYVSVDSGTAIIAGDAAYSVELNVDRQVPPGYFVDLGDAMDALRRLAREGDHVLPSHDPAVYERYPTGVR